MNKLKTILQNIDVESKGKLFESIKKSINTSSFSNKGSPKDINRIICFIACDYEITEKQTQKIKTLTEQNDIILDLIFILICQLKNTKI